MRIWRASVSTKVPVLRNFYFYFLDVVALGHVGLIGSKKHTYIYMSMRNGKLRTVICNVWLFSIYQNSNFNPRLWSWNKRNCTEIQGNKKIFLWCSASQLHSLEVKQNIQYIESGAIIFIQLLIVHEVLVCYRVDINKPLWTSLSPEAMRHGQDVYTTWSLKYLKSDSWKLI
jgi:hypothetical protein